MYFAILYQNKSVPHRKMKRHYGIKWRDTMVLDYGLYRESL